MKADRLIPYAEDYKNYINCPFESAFFRIRIDFSFALSIPGMEEKVYYRKDHMDATGHMASVGERLNAMGIYLEISYRTADLEITGIEVTFGHLCRAVFGRPEEWETIADMFLKNRQEAFCS